MIYKFIDQSISKISIIYKQLFYLEATLRFKSDHLLTQKLEILNDAAQCLTPTRSPLHTPPPTQCQQVIWLWTITPCFES